MNERKPLRPKNDDQWRLDPGDVRRHALRAAEGKRRGPFAKIVRYVPIALAVAVGVLVYANFEMLRGITVDFSRLTSLFDRDAAPSADGALGSNEELGTEVVEAPVIVSVAPDAASESAPEPAPDASVAADSADALAATNAPESSDAPAPFDAGAELPTADDAPPPVPPPPAAPPEPETFVFGVPVQTVSESDAAAAVLVLRRGGTGGTSTVTWWTSSGTATAGADYADLGRVVERFAPGQQNRVLRVPIVGDGTVEQPETFYVHLAPGEGADPSAEVRTEVVINDDD